MRISEEIHASCRLNKVKELQMRIAQAIRNRMTGSLQNRKRLAKCLSRVRGNLHAGYPYFYKRLMKETFINIH